MGKELLKKRTKERLKTFGILIGLGLMSVLLIGIVSFIISSITSEAFTDMFFLVAIMFYIGFFAFASRS